MRLITFAGLLALCLWLVTLSRPRDAAAENLTVQLIANLPSGQPVGTVITWTASTTIGDPVE